MFKVHVILSFYRLTVLLRVINSSSDHDDPTEQEQATMKPPKWTSYIRELRTCLDGAADEVFLWSTSQNHHIFSVHGEEDEGAIAQPVEGILAPYRMCH